MRNSMTSEQHIELDLVEMRREIARLIERNEQLVASNGDLSALLLTADRRAGEAIKIIVAFRGLIEAETTKAALARLNEILINVVGTEDFVVLALRGDVFVPLGGMGPAVDHARQYPPSGDAITTCLSQRRAMGSLRWYGEEIAACIPLRVGDRLVGAIAIANLLAHRGVLNVYDDDVLRLLSTFASTAIIAAARRAEWTALPDVA